MEVKFDGLNQSWDNIFDPTTFEVLPMEINTNITSLKRSRGADDEEHPSTFNDIMTITSANLLQLLETQEENENLERLNKRRKIDHFYFLESLPRDLLVEVCKHLSSNDLLALECVNKSFRNNLFPFIWKQLAQFGGFSSVKEISSLVQTPAQTPRQYVLEKLVNLEYPMRYVNYIKLKCCDRQMNNTIRYNTPTRSLVLCRINQHCTYCGDQTKFSVHIMHDLFGCSKCQRKCFPVEGNVTLKQVGSCSRCRKVMVCDNCKYCRCTELCRTCDKYAECLVCQDCKVPLCGKCGYFCVDEKGGEFTERCEQCVKIHEEQQREDKVVAKRRRRRSGSESIEFSEDEEDQWEADFSDEDCVDCTQCEYSHGKFYCGMCGMKGLCEDCLEDHHRMCSEMFNDRLEQIDSILLLEESLYRHIKPTELLKELQEESMEEEEFNLMDVKPAVSANGIFQKASKTKELSWEESLARRDPKEQYFCRLKKHPRGSKWSETNPTNLE